MKQQERGGADARGVQSIEVGLRIIAPLLESRESLQLREVAAQANVPPAQAHAYLVSFRKMGLIEQEPETGRYRVGPYALQLALTRMQTFDSMRAAANAATDLREATGMTVAISKWGSFGPTVVFMQNGIDQVHIDTSIGTVYSVSGTATGMVFAAYMPIETIRAAIRSEQKEGKHTLRVGTTRSISAISPDLIQVRANGYATIHPNPVPGIEAISAPVFDHTNHIQMAVTIIGTVQSRKFEEKSQLIGKLLAASAALSFEHGYFPVPSI